MRESVPAGGDNSRVAGYPTRQAADSPMSFR